MQAAFKNTDLCSYNKLHMAPKEKGKTNWVGNEWSKTRFVPEKIIKEAIWIDSCICNSNVSGTSVVGH